MISDAGEMGEFESYGHIRTWLQSNQIVIIEKFGPLQPAMFFL